MTSTIPSSPAAPPSGPHGPPPAPPIAGAHRRPAPARSVGVRRGGVPSGRAMLGALLVVAAALGLFATYLAARSGPSGRFVVAATDVAPGTRLDRDDLLVVTMDLPGSVAGGAFTTPDDLVGGVAVAPLTEGELIQRSAVDDDPQPEAPGFTVSFAIEADRAAGGRLEAGQTVAILVTYANGSQSVTSVIAEDATVISFDRAGDDALDALDETVLTVRLPTTANPLEVVNAARVGELTVLDTTFAGDAELQDEFRPAVPGVDPSEPAEGE